MAPPHDVEMSTLRDTSFSYVPTSDTEEPLRNGVTTPAEA